MMKQEEKEVAFDLLSTVEYGGCSAKLDPDKLRALLKDLPIPTDPNVLVDVSTHDDAGVYRISDDKALIVTTDFFPPVCSDPFTFGRIAAANALSDVYAMGGSPLCALNLVMFPSNGAPLDALAEIIKGGQSILNEASCLMMGGHTIDDAVPKYGLAVVGMVDPRKMITNSGAREDTLLILTKALGTGVAIAGHRLGIINQEDYRAALESMATLNNDAARIALKYNASAGTDITGFGLIGHTMQMADASGTTAEFWTRSLPILPGALSLLDDGCIPGAAFRNLRYVGDALRADVPLAYKMIAADAQTSGGLLLCVDPEKASDCMADLHRAGISDAAIVGRMIHRMDNLSVRLTEHIPTDLA